MGTLIKIQMKEKWWGKSSPYETLSHIFKSYLLHFQ